jgi:hypothetical protein
VYKSQRVMNVKRPILGILVWLLAFVIGVYILDIAGWHLLYGFITGLAVGTILILDY